MGTFRLHSFLLELSSMTELLVEIVSLTAVAGQVFVKSSSFQTESSARWGQKFAHSTSI